MFYILVKIVNYFFVNKFVKIIYINTTLFNLNYIGKGYKKS